jgi:hypothetical protein
MRRLLQIATGLTLVAASATAQAQRPPRVMTRMTSGIVAPRMTPVVVAPARTRLGRTQQTLISLDTFLPGSEFFPAGTSVNGAFSTFGTFPAPGFGFDFVHFFAVNRNFGVRALIDLATQLQLALAARIARETPFLAFPFGAPFFASGTPGVIAVPQPQVIVVQQPAPVEERPELVRQTEAEAAPRREPEPVAELGELVLVRTDGKIVFAVAFSQVKDRVVYVTREGIRRSFPLSELDADVTRQMNEERGTTLRLPI